MTIELKNELKRKIKEFEDKTSSEGIRGRYYEKNIFNIIEPLFENDGYTLKFQHGPGDGGIDFVATHNTTSEKIGIDYKHQEGRVMTGTIRSLVGAAVINSFDRMFLITNSKFSKKSYEIIKKIEPISLDLLNFNDLKNWISRIDTESDLSKLDYGNIIKAVSNEFIRRIAENPDYLLNIEWRELEKTIADIFDGLAFKVTLTPPSKDGGKDIILECTRHGMQKSYIIEIKHWRSMQRVGQKSVKDFLKVICNEKRESGVFLSTYGFTENAFEGISEIERKKIKFGDQNKIVSLCKTYLKVNSGIWTPLNDLQELLFEQTE